LPQAESMAESESNGEDEPMMSEDEEDRINDTGRHL